MRIRLLRSSALIHGTLYSWFLFESFTVVNPFVHNSFGDATSVSVTLVSYSNETEANPSAEHTCIAAEHSFLQWDTENEIDM